VVYTNIRHTCFLFLSDIYKSPNPWKSNVQIETRFHPPVRDATVRRLWMKASPSPKMPPNKASTCVFAKPCFLWRNPVCRLVFFGYRWTWGRSNKKTYEYLCIYQDLSIFFVNFFVVKNDYVCAVSFFLKGCVVCCCIHIYWLYRLIGIREDTGPPRKNGGFATVSYELIGKKIRS